MAMTSPTPPPNVHDQIVDILTKALVGEYQSVDDVADEIEQFMQIHPDYEAGYYTGSSAAWAVFRRRLDVTRQHLIEAMSLLSTVPMPGYTNPDDVARWEEHHDALKQSVRSLGSFSPAPTPHDHDLSVDTHVAIDAVLNRCSFTWTDDPPIGATHACKLRWSHHNEPHTCRAAGCTSTHS